MFFRLERYGRRSWERNRWFNSYSRMMVNMLAWAELKDVIRIHGTPSIGCNRYPLREEIKRIHSLTLALGALEMWDVLRGRYTHLRNGIWWVRAKLAEAYWSNHVYKLSGHGRISKANLKTTVFLCSRWLHHSWNSLAGGPLPSFDRWGFSEVF